MSRPQGHNKYTFLHFTTTVQFKFGDEIINARPGACIFFTPAVPQWFHSKTDVVHNWLHAESDLADLLELYNIPQNQILYPENTAFISEIFHEIEMEFFSDNPNRERLIEVYINEFLIKFSRALQKNNTTEHITRKLKTKMRYARQYMLSRPEHPWTVAEMASIASLSASRFHAVYKTMFASSPMRDLISARIDYAKSLLLSDEEKTVSQIAEKLGYNDQYHFIRQFKSIIGKTPGAYRKAKK